VNLVVKRKVPETLVHVIKVNRTEFGKGEEEIGVADLDLISQIEKEVLRQERFVVPSSKGIAHIYFLILSLKFSSKTQCRNIPKEPESSFPKSTISSFYLFSQLSSPIN
jgi:hypothetical protein